MIVKIKIPNTAKLSEALFAEQNLSTTVDTLRMERETLFPPRLDDFFNPVVRTRSRRRPIDISTRFRFNSELLTHECMPLKCYFGVWYF